tara:strand:+ start:1024 stop:2073 length:1050 start_codon:yes stop_codon:yes gene_type:complete
MQLNIQNSFKEFCHKNKFELNNKQIEIVKSLEEFFFPKKRFLNFFSKTKKKCFYLYGNVGVGKTMIMQHIFDQINIKKTQVHFNEFMINFHDFRHKKKDDNTITKFVQFLKKESDLIYLDEFQVTNIVDAMILGKLFEIVFSEDIKILITTNTKLNDLYKDGLQREQFIPFIDLIKKNSIQRSLILEDDYRLHNHDEKQRIFYPINTKTLFNINKNFRILTKNFKKEEKMINTKGRVFTIKNFYNGIARFNFNELCDQNFGAEDYLNISKVCKHLFIEEIPKFNDFNSNQQLRFITLIDILYEKKISLTLSMESELNKIGSSKKHSEIFKRTTSRLYELTMSKNLHFRL